MVLTDEEEESYRCDSYLSEAARDSGMERSHEGTKIPHRDAVDS